MSKLSKLITGILAFNLLFYRHSPGLNISLFSCIVWILIVAGNRKKFADKTFLLLSASCFLSFLSFAWYGDGISFMAVFVSLFVTGFYTQYRKINYILYPILGFLNTITFPFRLFYFKYWLPRSAIRGGIKKWVATVVLPVLFFLLFFMVYTTGSDLFNDFYERILFGFDLPLVFGLTCLSFFLLYNLWFVYIPKPAIRFNQELQDDYQPRNGKRLMPAINLFDQKIEARSGEITLMLLNMLLLVFVVTYNYEQFFTITAPEKLSLETHQRIGTVIGSILLAIAVILYYFRQPDTVPMLKKLSFIWISLNSLLVLSAFSKNLQYIGEYGLTFRRISVCIFLILCLTGLAFTMIKIVHKKTNAFLINRMMIVCYISLIVFAPVNFSVIVTNFNLKYHKNDRYYLRSLPYNKLTLMKHFQKDADWQEYLERTQVYMKMEADEEFLSSTLYYRYVSSVMEKKKRMTGFMNRK